MMSSLIRFAFHPSLELIIVGAILNFVGFSNGSFLRVPNESCSVLNLRNATIDDASATYAMAAVGSAVRVSQTTIRRQPLVCVPTSSNLPIIPRVISSMNGAVDEASASDYCDLFTEQHTVIWDGPFRADKAAQRPKSYSVHRLVSFSILPPILELPR
jgi:hypothetical protein